jgi:Rieske 2Fe-2S family protein
MKSPAPIDPRGLADALAPFGHSRMLPRSAFVSEEVLAWERANFFDAGWVCAGRVSDLEIGGDQKAMKVGDTGVLFTRDSGANLHAFANICRHRGHELLACGARTNRGVIQCPYHAWSYELDGSLRLAPRFGDVPNFSPEHMGLVPVRHEIWGGWIFVNASGDAGPLSDVIAGFDEVCAPYELDRLVSVARHEYVLAANWKLPQENYHECYHCPLIHPELCEVSEASSGDNYSHTSGAWVGGTMDLEPHAETMSLGGASGGVAFRALDAVQRRKVVYVSLFPNLLVSLHPDYVLTHRIEPLTPSSSLVECSWLFAPEAVATPGFDPSYAVDFWDLTNRQDWSAVESVQRGMVSSHYMPGLLSSQEDAVYQFVTMVARGYVGEPVTSAPLQ